MPANYTWPTPAPVVIDDVMGSGIGLLKEKFGALSQDEGPYSRICIGNSVISLEPYRGCTLMCAYCMANNDLRGLRKTSNKSEAVIRTPEILYDTSLLVDAMARHPAFIAGKTVIGFCTGSTEVFLKNVNDNVWEGMKHMVALGLDNPIWLVVKSFGENNAVKWADRFEYLSNHGIKVIISITDAGLPSTVEPYQPPNRFEPFKVLTGSGVILSHHLRPVLPKISTYESLIASLEKSRGIVSSVCIGGLRIDPGMKLFWKSDVNYEYIPGNQNKEIDLSLVDKVADIISREGMPFFMHSSEMISYHLGINDYNLYKYRGDDTCFLNLGDDYDWLSSLSNKKQLESELRDIALSVGLDLTFRSENNGRIILDANLGYPEKHALIQAIGHSSLFQVKNNEV